MTNLLDITTFARASSATYTDSNGIIQTATANTPRVGHHTWDGSAWVNRGLLLESEARTNLFIRSAADSLTGLVTSGVTVVESGWGNGLSSAFLYTSGVTAWAYTVATTTAQNYVVSCVVECGDGLEPEFGGASATSSSNEFALVLNGAAINPLNYETVSLGSGRWFVYGVGPSSGGTFNCGVIKYNTNVADTLKVSGIQVEAGSTPTSYIPTSGSTATRAAETLTIPNPPWPATITGTELVTNGTDFTCATGSTPPNGWASIISTPTYDNTSGGLQVSHTAAANQGTSVELTGMLAGSIGLVEFDVTDVTSGGLSYLRIGDNGSDTDLSGTDIRPAFTDTGVGSYTYLFVAPTTDPVLKFFLNTSGVSSFTIDNISVKEITPRGLAIAMDGLVTYADAGAIFEGVFFGWNGVDTTNSIFASLDTSSVNVGRIQFRQYSQSVLDLVVTGPEIYSPGINVPFSIASRHGDNFINGAVDGTALTADTTPVALPDLSATDLQLGYDFMGTIKTFRMWGADIGDTGISEASS